MGLDIGEKTIAEYAGIIRGAKTIIWNGPMGVFEKPPFDRGTVALAKAVAESGAISRGGRRRFREGHQERRACRIRSATFRPAAARRWNFSRGSNCRASRRSPTNRRMTVFLLPGLLCDETIWTRSDATLWANSPMS